MISRSGSGITALLLMALVGGCGDSISQPGSNGPLPGAPRLSFEVQPTDGTAGETLPSVVVVAQQADGQVDVGASGSVTVTLVSAAGAKVSGTKAATMSGGRATFADLTIETSGTGYLLEATATGLSAARSLPFTILHGAPDSIFFANAPVAVPLGERFTASIGVLDRFGNAVLSAAEGVRLTLYRVNGTLDLGTATVQNGRAEFSGLDVPDRARGFELLADLASLHVQSEPFDVFLPLLDITVGDNHACVVADAHRSANGNPLDAGYVYCWGMNTSRQIQPSPTLHYLEPVPYPLSTSPEAITVSAGNQFTCIVTRGGRGRCWGRSDLGQMGDGRISAPRDANTIPQLFFTSIDAGESSACGIMATLTAEVVCWGSNRLRAVDSKLPAIVLLPTAVQGQSGGAEVSAGYFTCARVAGRARCWGKRDWGQLGDGIISNNSVGIADVLGGTDWVQVAAQQYHACGLDADGQAFCWGYNGSGQLGDGTTVQSARPVPVVQPAGTRFTRIAVGPEQTCALDTVGQAYCWGEDGPTLLGDPGAPFEVTAPERVQGDLRFSKIVLTSLGTKGTWVCGITTDRRGYCWGRKGEYLGDREAVGGVGPEPIN